MKISKCTLSTFLKLHLGFWRQLVGFDVMGHKYAIFRTSALFIPLKIHRHGWSKIPLFSHFLYCYYSLIIQQHWFWKYSTTKMLNSGKTTYNLHCWFQLSLVFQDIPQHTNIWPDLWVTPFLEFKGNPEVTQKKILLPNACVPILAKQQN